MFFDSHSILRVHDEDLLLVEGSETDGGPLRISGAFYDEDGRLAAKIERNRLIVFSEGWDTQFEGSTVTFRRGPRDIALRLIFIPRKGIRIDRLRLFRRGVAIEISDDVVHVGTQEIDVSPSRVMFQSCRTCIEVTHRTVAFGETPGPNASEMRGNITYDTCSFSAGLRVVEGSTAVLNNCAVRGGVILERGARLEMSGGAVIGSAPA